MSSASSTAFLMEATVLSMLITTPLRKPRDGLVPIPMISSPSSETLPTMAQIFVVPISSPTMMLSRLPVFMVSPPLSLFHDDLVVIVQVYVLQVGHLGPQISVNPRQPGK